MAEPTWPADGTRLPLRESAIYFPTEPDFARAGIAGKIRLETAQDGGLGPITATDFAELLPLEDVIHWESGEIHFPGGNFRRGVIVEFVGEPAPQAAAPGDDPVQEDAEAEPAAEPRLTPEQLRKLSRQQLLVHSRHFRAQLKEKRLERRSAVKAAIKAGFDPRTTEFEWKDFKKMLDEACPHLKEVTVRYYQKLVNELPRGS